MNDEFQFLKRFDSVISIGWLRFIIEYRSRLTLLPGSTYVNLALNQS